MEESRREGERDLYRAAELRSYRLGEVDFGVDGGALFVEDFLGFGGVGSIFRCSCE